jgi:hypothetical protein
MIAHALLGLWVRSFLASLARLRKDEPMWEDYYGWGGPQQYDWGGDYMQYATPISGGYSSYDPITLPPEFWPDQGTYDRTAEQMQSFGIAPPPIGTIDPRATSELGNALYNQESFLESPLAPALVMMGGAALGGAFANGGAGYGAALGGASTPAYTGAVTASGLPTGTAAAAGGGFGTLSGAVPAVGATPGIAGGIGATMPGILDSTGYPIPGTETVASGGNMWQNLLGGMSGNWGSLIGGLLGAIDANNQPDSMTTNQGGTSTSTYGQTLPGQITAPAGQALTSLQGLFQNRAGADPATLAAIQRLQGFGGQTNPYLDNVFNTAADSTQSRLASEFARSGRNVGGADHQGFRSDELQTLAAGIYGNGYEAERNRELASAMPLLGAGDYLRNLPMQDITQYLTGLQGLLPFFPGTQTQNTSQTGSVTQPLFNNPLAGFLGGAQLGSLFSRPGG